MCTICGSVVTLVTLGWLFCRIVRWHDARMSDHAAHRLSVPLTDDTRRQLEELASAERRTVARQAEYLIMQGLESEKRRTGDG